MARATTIWVLTSLGGQPNHAFTVRMELVSHLARPDTLLDGKRVFRLADGRTDNLSVYTWTAEDFLAANG